MKKQDIRVTTDAVIFFRDSGKIQVLLIKRAADPFKGKWALPGGFVEPEESLEHGAKRELEEETGLKVDRLCQLKTFGKPGRDPRGRTISIVFWGEIETAESVQGSDDAVEAGWFDIAELPELAFDHDEILAYAIDNLNSKSVNNTNLTEKTQYQSLAVPVQPNSSRAELREQIKKTKAKVGEIDLAKPLELIVMGIKKQETARCRLLGKDKELTLRASGLWKVAPGEIVTVMPKKHWSYARHPYLSADITDTRFDLAALNLTPLKLTDEGIWDPKDEYWGEEDDPLPEWAEEIIARGPRSQYEMEQILPGVNPEDMDIDTDPIGQAVELKECGDIAEAAQVLNGLLIADLRCLDAHAHLGNLEYDRQPELALRHYDIGRRIGELSLGSDFKGVLGWSMIDNRPYLRCLHGYALCLWRLERFDESADVFTRMLWLNPSDNQGACVNLRDVRSGQKLG